MRRENDEKSLKAEVNNSLRLFTVGTLLFTLIKTAIVYGKSLNAQSDNNQSSINNILFKITFAVLFFLFSFFTSISATKNKLICGKENYKIAFMATLIPFIFIYLIGLFALWVFDGWTDCFSETWGEYIIDFCGVKKDIPGYQVSKKSIGEGIWYYLFGVITLLVSFNTLLAENCNAFSIKKDEFKKYLNDKYTSRVGSGRIGSGRVGSC